MHLIAVIVPIRLPVCWEQELVQPLADWEVPSHADPRAVAESLPLRHLIVKRPQKD